MARGFGTTFGSATSDRISSAITAQNSLRSFSVWAYRNGPGGNSTGKIFEKGPGSEEHLAYVDASTAMEYRMAWTTAGVWQCAAPSASTWHHFGVSYDSGSASNDPIIYINGASQTLSLDTNPTGSKTNNTDPYTVGNRQSGTRNWDGMIAWFAIWDVILNAGEFLALGQGVCPLVIRPMSLIEFVPLAGSTTHSWVAGATTVTGTAVQPDAFPHHYPARRRRLYIPAVGGGSRPSLIGGKLTNSLLLGGLAR